MKNHLIAFYVLFFTLAIKVQGAYLFHNGKSDYSIVVPTTASVSEHTAAKELQSYMKEISGAELPICSDIPQKGQYIYIGYNKTIARTAPLAEEESYHYKTHNGNLFIWGGRNRGTLYGVFSFLENELGVRWYTEDYTKITRQSLYELPALDHYEKPCILHRLDLYYTPVTNAIWCAHNKLNEQYGPSHNNYGNTTAIYGSHTFYDFVPPALYQKSHPEYYSLINGKRVIQNGQLCLSNPNVLEIVKHNILETIEEHPGYWAYDVSQMDNQNFCQCANCTTLAKRYGGQSGLLLWFVNQVADAVQSSHPDVMISTFAYLYTRHTPSGIKPNRNVIIRLCDIECCFAHPITSETCSKNNAFLSDLKAWSALTDNIYIWDYAVNFFGYLAPYPNFHVLTQNIQTFAQYHTIALLEEGAHDAPWAEFSEMRQWILARLMWNPKQDVDSLAHNFCFDYYGKAAKTIYEFYLLTQQVPSAEHVIYNTTYEKTCYDSNMLQQGAALLQSALSSAKGDAVLLKRVNRVYAQLLYLKCKLQPSQARKDGTYSSLQQILRDDPTHVKEGSTDLEKLLKEPGYT